MFSFCDVPRSFPFGATLELGPGAWAGLAKEFRSFRPELEKLGVFGVFFPGPGDSLIEPLSHFGFLALLPVRHGQEEPIDRIAAVASSIDFVRASIAAFQSPFGTAPRPACSSCRPSGASSYRFPGQWDCPFRVAEGSIESGRQEPGEVVIRAGLSRIDLDFAFEIGQGLLPHPRA